MAPVIVAVSASVRLNIGVITVFAAFGTYGKAVVSMFARIGVSFAAVMFTARVLVSLRLPSLAVTLKLSTLLLSNPLIAVAFGA